MRALVTGATGMVGRHIAERLLADGWTVRALVRNPTTGEARELRDLNVELCVGNVLDQPSFVEAARGQDVVFHTAAEIITRGWDAYRTVNVDGTRNAISAAAAAGARLLQLSSVAVYGSESRYLGERQGMKTSEDLPLMPLHERAYYARSKRESEELVMDAHRSGRIWATAVRPDVIYGRHDRQFVPRLARLLRFGLVPLIAGGRSTLAVVHAAAVADGAVRAATCDAAGGRAYNLANDFDVTVRDFFTFGARGLGVTPHFIPLPLGLARGGLRAVKWTARTLTLGRARIGGSTAVDFLTRDNPFTSARARRAGMDPHGATGGRRGGRVRLVERQAARGVNAKRARPVGRARWRTAERRAEISPFSSRPSPSSTCPSSSNPSSSCWSPSWWSPSSWPTNRSWPARRPS